MEAPRHIMVRKETGLTVEWTDGQALTYSVAFLRRMSPSAESRQLREEMTRNPLTVLPSRGRSPGGPLTILDAELVGNYAIRLRFSDGHDTGIYSWAYLRGLDPGSAD